MAHNPRHADVLVVGHLRAPVDVLAGGLLVVETALHVPVLVLDLQIEERRVLKLVELEVRRIR